MNTHRGIVNRVLWAQANEPLAAGNRVLQKTPLSFDVAVCELFWPLAAGARLVMARPGGQRDCEYLAQAIAGSGITHVHFVPSMLRAFLESLDGEDRGALQGLRRVVASGEPLSYDLQRQFHAALDAPLHNLYGPTEAAVEVTHWRCDRDDPRPLVPIGRPVANTRIHVLDRQGQEVPIGVPGELYIGGVQLARGYLGRPDLTAERFVPDPFAGRYGEPGARLYRSGDLARFLADGAIHCLGRCDHQVKVRGFRIELGEIESVLSGHPAVVEAVVVAREDRPGDRYLAAYLRPAGGAPAASELRVFLKERLPDYMVPSTFTVLGAFPLTPNGKVDRRRLPAPEERRAGTRAAFLAPRDEIERAIAAVWRDVLRLDEVGVDDNFFDLGGHSLLLVQVQAKLREALARDIAIVEMFQYPTIRALATHLARAPVAAQAR
jgi:acyl-coenzyme A synthetase/AMP-(fatty) acid ligase/acyl carrier protein